MLDNQNMPSINQTQAKIKLVEMWKASHWQNNAIKIQKCKNLEGAVKTRGITSQNYKVNNTPKTFIGDATGQWNNTHPTLKMHHP